MQVVTNQRFVRVPNFNVLQGLTNLFQSISFAFVINTKFAQKSVLRKFVPLKVFVYISQHENGAWPNQAQIWPLERFVRNEPKA